MQNCQIRPFSVKLQSALEGGGRGNARKDLREMSCSQMRRFKVETADLRHQRRLSFARWNKRETVPIIEVRSSRFSVEVTTSTNRDWAMGKGESKPSATAKRPSLETWRDWQRQSLKRLVLRVFAAKRKRPAVVEFTAGRVKLGGGVSGARTRDLYDVNVPL